MSKNKRSDAQKRADRQYEKKREGQRTRNWTAIFYPDDLPADWTSIVDDLHFKWIQSPLHDKDFNADGKPKKLHWHVLFMFESVKTKEQVLDLLKEGLGSSNSDSIAGVAIPQRVSDKCALVRYMAHMDNPDKAQYEISDIIGHNGAHPAELLKYSATETREMIVSMEEYIENNNIVELANFSKAIRYKYPEWHTILATKMTIYFNSFIRSQRYIFKENKEKEIRIIQVDSNGELIKD